MEEVYRIIETEEMRAAKEKRITNAETADNNYVVVEDGKIKRVCVGSHYEGCSCEYDNASQDCKYDCVKRLARRMTSKDKDIVLAALKSAKKENKKQNGYLKALAKSFLRKWKKTK